MSPITERIGEFGSELAQAGEGNVLDVAGAGVEVVLLHRADRRQCRGAGHRVAAVGAAQSARVDGVEQVGAAGDGGQRHAAGDALGHGDDVRDDALVVDGEPFPGAAEAGLDLVRDEDDALVLGPGGERRQEALGRDDEAALALDRFDDDRGDLVAAELLLDHR